MSLRVGFANSSIKRDQILSSTDSVLKHGHHLSKFTVSKRFLPKVPELLLLKGKGDSCIDEDIREIDNMLYANESSQVCKNKKKKGKHH